MRNKIAAVLGSAALILGGAAISTAVAAPASADSCTGIWSIGMAGYNIYGGQDSAYFTVNQRVGYNAYDTEGGINELNRLYWKHRSECPADHIMILAHSEGADLTHVWLQRNPNLSNTNTILISDPRRPAGPGSAGFGGDPLSGVVAPIISPLAGADGNYGGNQVLQVCRANDVICNEEAGWDGYLNRGAHGAYSFSAYDYSVDDSGLLWLPAV